MKLLTSHLTGFHGKYETNKLLQPIENLCAVSDGYTLTRAWESAPEPMKLDHIQLAMPEGAEDNAREFFVRLLGMTEQQKPEPLASRGGCWFRKDGVIIHVGVEQDFRPQRKAHPAFVVDDLARLATALKEQNFEVVWDDALPDRKRFYTTDPFGNRIEFIRDGDGFSQR